MTRQKAIATYKGRAKVLLAYKRQMMSVNVERAYKAQAWAQYCTNYARYLSELHPLDYIYMTLEKRAMIAANERNNTETTGINQLSLF